MRLYAVSLAAEQETPVGSSDISAGLLHIGSSEQAFLAEHY
jgi:hypothetical protein